MKNLKPLKLTCGILLFFFISTKKSNAINSDSLLLVLSEQYEEYIESYDPNGYIYFYENTIPTGILSSNFSELLGLPSSHELKLLKNWTDTLTGHSHFRFQQYYNGIRLEGAELTENSVEGFTYQINGKIANTLNISEVFGTDPQIDEKTALSNALEFLNHEMYAWQSDDYESEIKEVTGDTNATYLPKGELIFALDNYILPNYFIDPDKYKLAWCFNVFSLQPYSNLKVFVDAITGEIIRTSSQMCSNGTATTILYGQKNIDTRFQGGVGAKHHLHANDGIRNIKTKPYDPLFTYKNIDVYWHPNNSGNWGTDYWEPTNVHWCATQSHDYFYSTFFRKGMDNNQGELGIYPNYYAEEGAFYIQPTATTPDLLLIGKLENKFIGSIDIVGHEYTHGVTHHTSDLVYEDEPGALNESFSDIFGIAIERYSQTPLWPLWTIGEYTGVSSIYVRDFENPNQGGYHFNPIDCETPILGQPDTYNGTYFHTDTCDFGGVHINSGVQNKWFYLIANGGTHNGITVQSIGFNIAARHAYLNMTKLNSNAQFTDARSQSIGQIVYDYGSCSFEHQQVAKAWAAVGIGNPANCGSSSIKEKFNLLNVNVYPNPALDMVAIEFERFNAAQIQIYSVTGQLIIHKKVNGGATHFIDISELEKGYYFINGLNNEGYKSKIVKLLKID